MVCFDGDATILYTFHFLTVSSLSGSSQYKAFQILTQKMEQVSDNFLTQVLDVFSKFNSTLTRVRKGKLIKVIIYM